MTTFPHRPGTILMTTGSLSQGKVRSLPLVLEALNWSRVFPTFQVNALTWRMGTSQIQTRFRRTPASRGTKTKSGQSFPSSVEGSFSLGFLPHGQFCFPIEICLSVPRDCNSPLIHELFLDILVCKLIFSCPLLRGCSFSNITNNHANVQSNIASCHETDWIDMPLGMEYFSQWHGRDDRQFLLSHSWTLSD